MQTSQDRTPAPEVRQQGAQLWAENQQELEAFERSCNVIRDRTTGIAKGYYILMRETTSAFWQKKIYTTSLEMMLPYSKDNYFFAVQSVNESGNESLPVVPSLRTR